MVEENIMRILARLVFFVCMHTYIYQQMFLELPSRLGLGYPDKIR